MHTPAGDEHDRFTVLFRATAHRVRAYASRHIDRDEVDEVVAETYATAWRRRDRFDFDDAVPWLLVTARHVISNRRRQRARRDLPHPDLESVAALLPSAEGPVVDRSVALAALADLSAVEREAVLLIAWDGLDQKSAALVAGCSVRAFTVRLHRARSRLARQFDAAASTSQERGPAATGARRTPTIAKDLT